MSGTVKGGQKAAAKNKQLYGVDFYTLIGRSGGAKSRGGGFARDPELASAAGRLGGMTSTREGVKNTGPMRRKRSKARVAVAKARERYQGRFLPAGVTAEMMRDMTGISAPVRKKRAPQPREHGRFVKVVSNPPLPTEPDGLGPEASQYDKSIDKTFEKNVEHDAFMKGLLGEPCTIEDHRRIHTDSYNAGAAIKNRYYLVWAIGTGLGWGAIYYAIHLYHL